MIGCQSSEFMMPNLILYQSLAVVPLVFCQVPASFVSIVSLIDIAQMFIALASELGPRRFLLVHIMPWECYQIEISVERIINLSGHTVAWAGFGCFQLSYHIRHNVDIV